MMDTSLQNSSPGSHKNGPELFVPGALLPSLLLTNANHITNKLDELSLLVSGSRQILDVVSITESWLSDDIPNCLCDLPNYTIFRRDRKQGLGGAVIFSF